MRRAGRMRYLRWPVRVLSHVAVLAIFILVLSAPCLADPVVRMETTRGPIFIRVFLGMVPSTARNFLDLVSRGFYAGKTFHRIESWCIQGGDPNGNGTGSFIDPETGAARFINLEINRNLSHNSPGVVAMARSQNPNSASCQFYITKSAVRRLDGQYAIFGHVIRGMEAVYAMRPGDTIVSAEIVSQGTASNNANNAHRAGRRSLRDPKPYNPPSESEIPDSGF